MSRKTRRPGCAMILTAESDSAQPDRTRSRGMGSANCERCGVFSKRRYNFGRVSHDEDTQTAYNEREIERQTRCFMEN